MGAASMARRGGGRAERAGSRSLRAVASPRDTCHVRKCDVHSGPGTVGGRSHLGLHFDKVTHILTLGRYTIRPPRAQAGAVMPEVTFPY